MISSNSYGLPYDYAETTAARVEAVTLDGVNARAKQVIRPDELTWVIVGDLEEIEDKVLNFNEMLKQEMIQAKIDAGTFEEDKEEGAEGEEAEFKSGVKTYVVSAGILYGKGEAIFNSHLRQAWK